MWKKFSTLAFLGVLLCSQVQADEFCAEQNCCETDCCENSSWFGSAEYIYWWVRDRNHVPPLVVSDANADLLGGKRHHNKERGRSGGRFTLGYWFGNDCGCGGYGTDIRYFCVGREERKRVIRSDATPGSAVLLFPFFNQVINQNGSIAIAIPGEFSGKAKFKISNDFQGAEWNFLAKWKDDCCECPGNDVYFLAGFRYLNFYEKFTFATRRISLTEPNEVFFTKDQFRSDNNFYGGQLGIGGTFDWGCWNLRACAKVAFGGVCQERRLRGLLVTNAFTDLVTEETFPSGLLVQGSNRGKHTNTRFTWVPEVEFHLGYKVTDCVALTIGYNFLYLNRVSRNQIDRTINPSQSPAILGQADAVLVGEAFPKRNHRSKDLWIQGLTAGIDFLF